MARSHGNGTGYYNPMSERTSPKRSTFIEDPTASLFDQSKIRWLTPTHHSYTSNRNSFAEEERQRAASRQSSGRSLSADVCLFRKDSLSRWNERYINFSDHSRLISYRWMPETGISMSRYIPSPLARRTSDGDRPKFTCHEETLVPAGSTRWMTYVRNPSPCSLPRILSERRKEHPQPTESSQSSPARKTTEEPTPKRELPVIKKDEPPPSPPPPPPPPPPLIIPSKEVPKRIEVPDWHSIRKKPGRFEIPKKSADAQGRQEAQDQRSKFHQTTLDDTRLRQRLQELYDIKTEAEWPKRVRKESRESLVWTSRDEDKSSYPHSTQSRDSRQLETQSQADKQSSRRNSQDLEFNDRSLTSSSTSSSSNNPSQTRPSDSTRKPSLPKPQSNARPESSLQGTRMHFSMDSARIEDDDNVTRVGDITFAKIKKIKDRRSFSDDYENPARRKIISETLINAENRRNIETPAPPPTPRSSTSSVSYVESPSSSLYNPLINKRGSVEFKSTTKKIELPHRRTMSQYEPRSRASIRFQTVRPRTPMPPPEIDLSSRKDFIVPEKIGGIPPRQRRNSTRYKVYLT